MGALVPPQPVLLVMAVCSRYGEALDWAAARAAAAYGPLLCQSEAFDFTETDYYQATMGSELKKQFLAFHNLIDPGDISRVKRTTNDWEAEYAAVIDCPEQRPLNLDPGYLTLAKLVLATTKDHAHRLYVGDEIYAEVTLTFRGKRWQKNDWTYPDYQRPDYHNFFTSCRQSLQERRRQGEPFDGE